MKSLKKVARLSKIKPAKVLSFVQNPERIIEKQSERIDYLEEKLVSLLIRDEEQREADIQKEINYLSTLENKDLPMYVLNTYNTKFFLNECDSDFKMQLSRTIVDYVRLFYPSYKNPLLEEVAEGSSRYAANYIFVM